MNKKILGIVVIYKPNINKLISNINKYIDDISYLIIWENSTLLRSEKNLIIDNCINSEKIIFAGNGINQGLSIAFNYALDKANKCRYEYLMTMDQDSEWINFSNYLSKLKQINNSKIAVFGPKVINVFDDHFFENDNDEVSLTDFVISSGAVYKVNILSTIGGFADKYFIDAIDEEICYRAFASGYETVRINSSFLLQEFGKYKKKKILGRSFATSNYSPFRYYHITRNHLWLANSKYVNKHQKKVMIYNYVLCPVVKVFFERDTFKKLIAIFKGIVDGIYKSPSERRKL